MVTLLKRFVFVTENESHYEVDTEGKRIRKLFRKPMLPKGSERLSDGKWHMYDRIKLLDVGIRGVIYWTKGDQVLVTSIVKTLIEISEGHDYDDNE